MPKNDLIHTLLLNSSLVVVGHIKRTKCKASSLFYVNSNTFNDI